MASVISSYSTNSYGFGKKGLGNSIYTGIFTNERVLQFLRVTRELATDLLQEFYSQAVNQDQEYQDELAQSRKPVPLEKRLTLKGRFLNGLETIQTWGEDIYTSEAVIAVSQCRDITQLYKYTLLLYIKELLHDQPHVRFELAFPSLGIFLKYFYCRLAKSDQVKTLFFFSPDFLGTEKDFFFIEAMRSALSDCSNLAIKMLGTNDSGTGTNQSTLNSSRLYSNVSSLVPVLAPVPQPQPSSIRTMSEVPVQHNTPVSAGPVFNFENKKAPSEIPRAPSEIPKAASIKPASTISKAPIKELPIKTNSATPKTYSSVSGQYKVVEIENSRNSDEKNEKRENEHSRRRRRKRRHRHHEKHEKGEKDEKDKASPNSGSESSSSSSSSESESGSSSSSSYGYDEEDERAAIEYARQDPKLSMYLDTSIRSLDREKANQSGRSNTSQRSVKSKLDSMSVCSNMTSISQRIEKSREPSKGVGMNLPWLHKPVVLSVAPEEDEVKEVELLRE